MSFWLFFLVCFLVFWPFLAALYLIGKHGPVKATKMLEEQQLLLKTVRRLYRVCQHIADCSQNALRSCKYVNGRLPIIAASLINKGLVARNEGKEVEWTPDELHIISIINSDESLVGTLVQDFLKIADKVESSTQINLNSLRNKSTREYLNKFIDMTDADIVRYFVSDDVLERCRELAFAERFAKAEESCSN